MTPGSNELEGQINMNRHVGFTGTQKGMTSEQIYEVDKLLMDDLLTSTSHDGDCIGADADFNKLSKLSGLKRHGHPPINPSKRAWCDYDFIEEEKDYHERNHDIVDASDWMIACPAGFVEELRSGTWSTVRYARKNNRPGVIVWPDGKVTDINEKYQK